MLRLFPFGGGQDGATGCAQGDSHKEAADATDAGRGRESARREKVAHARLFQRLEGLRRQLLEGLLSASGAGNQPHNESDDRVYGPGDCARQSALFGSLSDRPGRGQPLGRQRADARIGQQERDTGAATDDLSG